MRPSQQNVWRELAVREGDGLQITLHWSTSAYRVRVSVLDLRHDESFDLHVAKAQALSAFYHPFAYAAGRGPGFPGAMRESLSPERSAA
jgi:hypothetical protein